MRVVLDTNVFISSLLTPEGNPRKVIDLWRFEKITLCLSKDTLAEYFSALVRLGIADEPEAAELVHLFEERYNQVYCMSDPADNKFIECAGAASAKCIISGDRHLLNLHRFKGIRIMSPAEFLAAVGG